MTAVVPMIAADMAGHPPLHEGTEGRMGGGLQDQMKMIWHQTETKDLDRMSGFRYGEQVEERGEVAVLVEDRGAAVPAIEHMVGVPGDLTTRNARHGVNTVGEDQARRQEKSSLSPFPSLFRRQSKTRPPLSGSADSGATLER